MATATQSVAAPVSSTVNLGRAQYRCECGEVLRVVGLGRHRIFFEPGKGRGDPVLNRACPQCGRGLPGKGQPIIAAVTRRTPHHEGQS